MRKFLLLVSFVLLSFHYCFGHHVKGGWIGYTYLGTGLKANTSRYNISVYLYVECKNTNSYVNTVILGGFDSKARKVAFREEIPYESFKSYIKEEYSSCMITQPEVCYKVYTYSTTVTLDNNQNGYDISVGFRARVDSIVNIYNSGTTGITFFAKIPGTINDVDYHINNSPQFAFLDTTVICHNGKVSLPFYATDPDGDSLSYHFGPGLDCYPTTNGALQEPTYPPYHNLFYLDGFSGETPLGPTVVINSETGIISGTAPSTTGEYVVAVYILEWRNGILIDSVKKELQIRIEDCSLLSQILKPSYINCQNHQFTFQNSTTLLNAQYLWDFGVEGSNTDTSTLASPSFDYPDSGTFLLKLKVTTSPDCSDSATSIIKTYPVFKPDFTTTNLCALSNTKFTDITSSSYGSLSNWRWTFGDQVDDDDFIPDDENGTSSSTTHIYKSPGKYNVSMYVANSKGCSDTVSHTIVIADIYKLQLPFSDTLICSNDSLTLLSDNQDGTQYIWSSNTNGTLIQYNGSDPTVLPRNNTLFQVSAINKDGCEDTASISVSVLENIDLQIENNMKVCIGDSLFFKPTSQGNKYYWQLINGNDTLSNNYIASPGLKISGNNFYAVTASYGKNCAVTKDINILASPYPTIKIQENDTTICLGNSITLNASGTGTNNFWIPTDNTNLSNRVTPTKNTIYIIESSSPNSYCQKKVRDSILIKTVNNFDLKNTRDTSVVFSQPLTLNLTTNYPERNYQYKWEPSSYLDNDTLDNPTAIFPLGIIQQYYTVKVKDSYGCIGQTSFNVHIYNTATDIFVPSAFTPNGDGKNDYLRPTMLGIKKLELFQVFNRWGQLVFTTKNIGDGWNGYFNGTLAPNGSSFIYHIVGYDYKDQKIDQKGTSVLIR